jgi:hypothetical protein
MTLPDAGAGSGSNRYARSPQTVVQRVGDVLVVVHLRTDEIYELNGTAARIWELVCEGRSPADIERQLVREFRVEGSVAGAAVERVIGELRAARLIDEAAGESGGHS